MPLCLFRSQFVYVCIHLLLNHLRQLATVVVVLSSSITSISSVKEGERDHKWSSQVALPIAPRRHNKRTLMMMMMLLKRTQQTQQSSAILEIAVFDALLPPSLGKIEWLMLMLPLLPPASAAAAPQANQVSVSVRFLAQPVSPFLLIIVPLSRVTCNSA